jgi:uncharacterized protein (TIGR02466 family)
MITKHEWWSTPVWEIETGFDEYFNMILNNELNDTSKNDKNITLTNFTNILECESECMKQLKEKIVESLYLCVSDYFKKSHPRGYEPYFTTSWLNYQKPGENFFLHDHPEMVMAFTYYLVSDENSGDLLLLDPRGSINWDWENCSFDKKYSGYTGSKCKTIKPKPGKLVFFPSYLLHMVEQNNSKRTRISISGNIRNGYEDNINICKIV